MPLHRRWKLQEYKIQHNTSAWKCCIHEKTPSSYLSYSERFYSHNGTTPALIKRNFGNPVAYSFFTHTNPLTPEHYYLSLLISTDNRRVLVQRKTMEQSSILLPFAYRFFNIRLSLGNHLQDVVIILLRRGRVGDYRDGGVVCGMGQSVVQCGVVWCGVVLCGIVWCGLVQCTNWTRQYIPVFKSEQHSHKIS